MVILFFLNCCVLSFLLFSSPISCFFVQQQDQVCDGEFACSSGLPLHSYSAPPLYGMISSDRYKEHLQKTAPLSLHRLGRASVFLPCGSALEVLGSHLSFRGPESEASRALCSGHNSTVPVGHQCDAGGPGWPFRCLGFLRCRPDFGWDTLCLSQR